MNTDSITFTQFKTWLTELIIEKNGKLPDIDDWREIKTMMDRVEEVSTPIKSAPQIEYSATAMREAEKIQQLHEDYMPFELDPPAEYSTAAKWGLRPAHHLQQQSNHRLHDDYIREMTQTWMNPNSDSMFQGTCAASPTTEEAPMWDFDNLKEELDRITKELKS